MGAIDDLVSTMQGGVQNLGQLVQVMSAIFPRSIGTFILTSGSATTAVAQPKMVANGMVAWFPTNAAAGTLQGSAKNLYLASVSAGVGFSLVTSNGQTAAGTESFTYVAINPI